MSDAVFPRLPGLAWGVVKRPLWKTVVHESASGVEARLAYYTRPRWRWTLTYDLLRQGGAEQEFETLAGFFNLRRGRWDAFLFEDATDNTVTDHLFGIGDGARTRFPVTRTFGGFTEPVSSVTAFGAITVDGAPASVLSSDVTDGQQDVTFTTAPAAGASLRWTGTYRWRVRFDQDAADFSTFARAFWELRQLTLISVHR